MDNANNPAPTYQQALQQLTAPGSMYATEQQNIDGVEYTSFTNAPQNILEIISPGRSFGDKIFIHYEGESLTFADFFNAADNCTAWLREQIAITKGDRVAIVMRNYPEWLIAYVAIVSLGAIPVLLNSWSTKEDMIYMLSDAKVTSLFCDQQRYTALADFIKDARLNAVIARPDGQPQLPAVNMQDLMEYRGEPWTTPQLNSSDVLMLMYTSGTTSRPKGALCTQGAFGQTVFNFECNVACIMAMIPPEALAQMAQNPNPPCCLLAVPLFHVSGFHSLFIPSIRTGRTMVMMYKWLPEQAIELIDKHKITMLTVAPPMVQQLIDSKDFSPQKLSSLTMIGSGGMATPAALFTKMITALPTSPPGTGYGMTETNGCGTTINAGDYRARPSSSGTPGPIIEITVRDEQGKEVPIGETGELWIKSSANMSGYWNNDTATKDTFYQGWVKTGDIGYFDAENYLYVVDRIKDVVIRAGENVPSLEVEAALAGYSEIVESAVFGIADEKLGEKVVAVIRPIAEKSIALAELQQYLQKHLPRYKIPEQFVIVAEPLPRNPAGKLLKKQLRQQHFGSS